MELSGVRLNLAQPWGIPWVVAGVFLTIASLFAVNSLELIGATWVAIAGARIALRVNVFPVLLALVFPFLEIVTSVLDAEGTGQNMNDRFYGHGREVYWISLLGLCAMFAGWRWIVGRRIQFSVQQMEHRLIGMDLQRLVVLHVGLIALDRVVDFLIPYGSSLAQITLHLGKLPLIVLYLIVWRYRVKPEHKWLFVLVITLNVLASFLSFFSSWKEVIIMFGFILTATKAQPDVKTIRRLGIAVLTSFLFIYTWQGIKQDYRNFLNGGDQSQRILVSNSEALAKFTELTATYWSGGELEIGSSNTADVTRATLERVGYIDLFSRMRQYVPSEIPHEDGGLTAANLSFALIPRILNPNKGVKDDQWKVEKYAKRMIGDNASFSLGHFAEHYVDFGSRGMWVSLLLFGVGLGLLTIFFLRPSAMPGCDLLYLFLVLSKAFSYQADAITIYGQVFWGSVFWLVFGRRIMSFGMRILKV
jgi:hypothetical protein